MTHRLGVRPGWKFRLVYQCYSSQRLFQIFNRYHVTLQMILLLWVITTYAQPYVCHPHLQLFPEDLELLLKQNNARSSSTCAQMYSILKNRFLTYLTTSNPNKLLPSSNFSPKFGNGTTNTRTRKRNRGKRGPVYSQPEREYIQHTKNSCFSNAED